MKNYNDRGLAIPASLAKQKQSWRSRLANWLNKNESNGANVPIAKEIRSIDRGVGTVSFTVHPASGGYVVESNYYNESKDRHERNLHIITSQEDFSAELGKAVFMDMLKNR
jgi:hypothetical protein